MPPIAIVGAMVVAGAVAGSIKKSSTTESSSGVNLADANNLETSAFSDQTNQWQKLRDMTAAGPGQSDVSNSVGATRDLASLLQQYQQTGGAPSQADIGQGNDLASKLFGKRQTALDQSFTQQNYDSQRLSARLGRSQDDPILQAKLRTGYMNQQASLDAEKGGWATNYAMQLPQQRLGYAQARTQVLGGLASQAFQNRSTLLSLGNQIGNQERNFRLATAEHYGTNTTTSGGGIGGAITGGISGAGAGMSMGAGGLFGGGGASSSFGNSPYEMQQGPWAGGYGSGNQVNGFSGR